MSRHLVAVDLHGDHVHVDLSRVPRSARPAVAAALAHHEGIELLPMQLAKVGGGEGPDPRFPELEALIEQARTRWTRWTRWLLDRLIGRVETRTATPPAVAALLTTHEIGVTTAVTGAVVTTPVAEPLVLDPTLLPPRPEIHAPIAVAFRLGRDVDPAAPPTIPDAPRLPPPVAELSEADQAALAYVRTRAAIYMRRPIALVRETAERVLLDGGIPLESRALTAGELEKVRATIGETIVTGRSAAATASALREALSDARLETDFMRVAVTEIASAHHHGAYAALRARLPADADPEVYKIASPQACSECLRIWGHPSNPRHYKLSELEAFTASGGNFGKPRKDWGPTIGPTHPRCLCPPLLRWDPAVHDAVTDAAAELRKIFG